MMAPGFKPVGWVGAVSAAALACYMLSLNVASERADLARVERQIVSTKQDIRSLQTELGTRGRLSQLEQWNADVLALSAPASTQYLDNEVKLARFEQHAPTMDERVKVQMAAAVVAPAPEQKIVAPVVQAAVPVPAPAPAHTLVHQASFELPAQPVAAAPLHKIAPEPARAAVKTVKTADAAHSAAPVKSVIAKAAAVKPAPAKAEAAHASLGERLKAASPAKPAVTKTALATSKDGQAPKAASAKKSGLRIDDKLIADIRTAAKAEAGPSHR